MNKVTLGKSDVKISPIVFGAWAIGGWMWGGSDVKEAIEAIHAGIDAGISSIDTAPIYGFGKSEEIVGKAIKNTPRNKLEILTKFGMKWDSSLGEFYFTSSDENGNSLNIHKFSGRQSIIEECELSLKRLGTDYIDLYQIHWPDPTTPIEESFLAAEQLLKEGKIRAAGVCNYTVEQMQRAASVVPLASNQVPYSMVLRNIEKDVVPYCVKTGSGILAYSPLQRGLLTGKITNDYTFAKGDHRAENKFFLPPLLSRINQFLDHIRPIAESYNASLTQLVINWTIQQTGISAALVGARNKEQMNHNADALSFTISQSHLSEISQLLSHLDLS